METNTNTPDEFYLQDSRSYVGNDILFWRDGGGYTTNVNEAEVFTKEAALRQNRSRETDIPWPKNYIDNKTRPAVDMQYTNIKSALRGLGITLFKQPKAPKQRYRCCYCGVFISEYQNYGSECPKCGGDNRP